MQCNILQPSILDILAKNLNNEKMLNVPWVLDKKNKINSSTVRTASGILFLNCQKSQFLQITASRMLKVTLLDPFFDKKGVEFPKIFVLLLNTCHFKMARI